MRLIDADRLKEQIAERIRTPRSTMEIKKDILPLINAQPDASDLEYVIKRTEHILKMTDGKSIIDGVKNSVAGEAVTAMSANMISLK